MTARPCPHPDVAVDAHTTRIEMPSGAVGAYLLTVSARCTACGRPFWFPGLPTGRSCAEPVTDPSGFRVTLPMAAEGDRNLVDPTLPHAVVRTSDVHKGHRAPEPRTPGLT